MLLVQADSLPPTTLGVDEGWVPADATDAEVEQCAREVLERLAASGKVEVHLVAERTWSCSSRTFRLSLLQARLFGELEAHRGTTVTHQRLMEVGWRGEPVPQWSLRSAIQRLREQLIGTGLHVRSARCVGFALL